MYLPRTLICRSYVHGINFPQNAGELASSLPWYSKDLCVMFVKAKGHDQLETNTFKHRTECADIINYI